MGMYRLSKGKGMKIKSEYSFLANCVENGITIGYNRAYKHTDEPNGNVIKEAMYIAIMDEIAENFIFDGEAYEG